MTMLSLSSLIIIMYIYKYKNFMMHIYITIFLSMIIVMNFSLKFINTSYLMSLDKLSLIMIILTTTSIFLIMISSSIFMKVFMTILPIMLTLILTFLSKTVISFYIMFEMVLIPTMILITMNGKQPERLQASIYLIMYTIMASLPLLMIIILFKLNMSFLFTYINMTKNSMLMFMMLAFLVKMPMFMTHLWLPKAHVEAPLEGSMILAAVLLKLGGYGIMRFIPMCMFMINKMNYYIISISMIGATITSLNCIRQKDLKSLIAYSSVAHMGFVLTSLFTMNYIGMMGAIIMMIAHGLTSSALFLLVNDLYFKYHSRNILLFKGLITLMPNITFWWFMFMALNISAPPTINTLSEILMMSSLIYWNNNSIMMMFMMSLMATSFSLMMFINIIHNKNNMLPSTLSPQKMFMSSTIHMMPTIMMIMKPEMLMV